MKLILAKTSQANAIWCILQDAIKRRKKDGSSQWQDGYPNLNTVHEDIKTQNGYVLLKNNDVVAYLAVKINDEPEYDNIVGTWKTNQDFIVVHRVAISKRYLGKGIATKVFKLLEDFAKTKHIYSIKVDTNFDNAPMLHIFEKLEYEYCGKVYFRGSERLAFEKVLYK